MSAPSIEDLPSGLADLPGHEILRELGRGGMGVVYLARDKLMGRLEVLKVVGGHLLDRGLVRERFLREIRSAAQLQHPNIVTAYSAMRAGDQIVLAMEYVDGYDLAKLVERGGPMPVAQACHFVYQAALGLQHAHERGMVHRDIKPGNLMLARQGNKPVVKILDFGLAKATQEAPMEGGLTREGQMLGTPDYIAPEQTLDAQKADIRADIYSLGCTLYYLLTGGPPFQANSLYEILQAHHSRYATPLNLARSDVPAELAALVEKMMAKAPSDRFQTPGAVAQALKPSFKPGEAGTLARPGRDADTGAVAAAPSASVSVTPAVEARRPAGPGSSFESVDLGHRDGPASDRLAARDRTGPHPAWLWIPVAAGALLLSLLLARGLVLDSGRPEPAPSPAPARAERPTDDRPRIDEPPRQEPAIAPPVPRHDEPPRAIVREAGPPGGEVIPREEVRKSTPAAPRPVGSPPDRGEKPPAEPVAEASRPGGRMEGKARPAIAAGDIRQLVAFAGPFRPANRDAEMPRLPFWPVAKPDNLSAWQVGDPERFEMDRDGVTLSAGPGGNLLLTRKEFGKHCALKLTLSVTKGTDAFLALRAHRGPDGWKAITARVFDEGGRIRAGYQATDFQLGEQGTRRESVAPDKSFVIHFQTNVRDAASLSVANQGVTSSMEYARTPVARYEGVAGVFVKSGTLVIYAMDVQD